MEMPECSNCGSHVTPDFARVFGDRDGAVHSCPQCATNAELQDGAAARGEIDQ